MHRRVVFAAQLTKCLHEAVGRRAVQSDEFEALPPALNQCRRVHVAVLVTERSAALVIEATQSGIELLDPLDRTREAILRAGKPAGVLSDATEPLVRQIRKQLAAFLLQPRQRRALVVRSSFGGRRRRTIRASRRVGAS